MIESGLIEFQKLDCCLNIKGVFVGLHLMKLKPFRFITRAFVICLSVFISHCLRQGNMKSLKWAQVDLDRSVCWIHPDQAIARRAIHVPL